MGVSAQSGSGSSKNQYSSNPVNLQNEQYQALASPIASGLLNFLTMGPGGVRALTPGQSYRGPVPQNFGNQQQGQNQSSFGNGQGGDAFSTILGAGGGGTGGSQGASRDPVSITDDQGGALFSPYSGAYGNYNNVNSNPLVAGLTRDQGQLTNNAGRIGAAGTGPGPAVAGRSGIDNANLNAWDAYQYASSNPLAAANANANRMLDPNYASSLATSDQTKAAVSTATQPLINAFNNTARPNQAAAFTAAGQRINQGGQIGLAQGSSAYERADNEAVNNLLAQIGATGGAITNNAYQKGLDQNANATNQSAALSGQQISNLGNSAAINEGIQGAQADTILKGLQGAALPQLTQQYGINQGLQLYQQQVGQLMQALGLGGQVSQPAIGNVASGTGSSEQSSKGMGISGLPKL